MADTNVFDSFSDLEVEEQLFAGIVSGPLEKYEGLLQTLEDVDLKGVKQRTLLHLGVTLGKLDWVKGLLGEGADPSLRDDGDVTAVDMAEGKSLMYPEDRDRQDILSLIQLVHRRDFAIKRRRELCRCVVANSSLTTHPQETVGLSAVKDSVNALQSDIVTLQNRIKESLDEVKRALSDRDVLLHCLETAVTSSAEVLTKLKERMEGTLGAGSDRRSVLVKEIRRECIDTLIERTTILNIDENSIPWVRSLFEKLYDESETTFWLLQFLKGQCHVEVIIDCGSKYIGNMKAKVSDYDGVEWDGNQWLSFTDFSEFRVYLGGKKDETRMDNDIIASLSLCLARMALLLAFENEGRPYERGHALNELQLRRALEEAEQKRNVGVELHGNIEYSLDKKSLLGKEIYFTSTVPWIIAKHGVRKGIRILRDQIPSLLNFYKNHVMGALVSKATVNSMSPDQCSGMPEPIAWEFDD